MIYGQVVLGMHIKMCKKLDWMLKSAKDVSKYNKNQLLGLQS